MTIPTSIFCRISIFITTIFCISCGNNNSSSTSKDESTQKQLAEKLYGKEADYDKGKVLFKQHCAVCHSLNDTKLTGPGLQGMHERLPSGDWLKNFLNNPDSMYHTEDPYILQLKKDHPYNSMTSFRHLSPQEMKDLIAFVHAQ